jgi:hypothetical protein
MDHGRGMRSSRVQGSISPTRVNATRRFFFGGPSVLFSFSPECVCGSVLEIPILSSTLAAGVKGGSLRFVPLLWLGVGVESTCAEGVVEEVVNGSEWWCAIDCSWSVCCCV